MENSNGAASTAMLRIARKYPLLSACVVVAVVSSSLLVFGIAFFELDATLAVIALVTFLAAFYLGFAIMNYNVFGGRPNSSIHRPDDNASDEPR
jgi:hypothetical protein